MKKAVSIIALVLALLMLPTIPVFANSEATTVSARPVFKYATLSFKGGVNMHFSVYYGDDVSSYKDYGLIFWTESQEEEDYTYAKAVEKKMTITHKADATDDTLEGYEGSKKFICPVEAHKMGDSIYVQGYIENSDGTYTYGKYVREYSPQIYAKNKLYGASKTSDQKLVNMIKSLLNFGADAQIYFDYKTDDLVNSIIQAASSADTLAAAIAKGGYVELEEDITLTSALTIAGNATINGNGKTITAASADRVFNVEGTSSNISIDLRDLNIVSNSGKAYDRGISFYQNTGKIRLNVDNCNITAGHYAINVAKENSDIEINVKNSEITGYAAAQTWSANSKLSFENCTLNGVNKWDGTDNDFDTIVVNDTAKDSELSFTNCTITATENGTAKELFFGVNCNADIIVNDCSFTKNGTAVNASDVPTEEYSYYSGNGNSGTILIDGERLVYNAAGLHTALKKGGNVNLTNDINMAGVEWAALTAEKAIVLNGNGHTISDLKVRHYTSVTNGVQYGFGFISNAKADVTIKKLTFTNADVGPEQAQIDAQKGNIGGVVMGYSSGKTVLEDVTVKNSTVSGYGKLGCLIGYVPSGTVTLTNCASTDNTINGGTNMGGLIGTVDSKATINRSNCTVDGIIFNKVRSEEQEPLYTLTSDVTVTTDRSASDYSDFTLRAGSTFNLNGSGYYGYKADYYTVITGNWGHVTIGEETYKFCEEIAVGVTTISGTLPNFATQGEDIVLSENVTGNAAIKSNTSNYKVGFVLNGGTLDGGGKTISVTGTGDHGIEVTSGTIENVTVTNAYRGIMTYNTTADSVITIDNVTVDGCGYGINTGVGTGGKLVVTNSTINGWSSWANLASASFTNCSFGTSTYYSGEMSQHYLRPYVTTTFEDCDIGQGFYLDLTKLPAGSTVTLKNCTCGSVKLTKANFADYVKIIKAVDGKTDVYAVNGDDLSNLIWGE